MNYKLLFGTFCLITMIGCTNNQPKCDDEEVKKLVAELSQETFKTDLSTNVNTIRLLDSDEKTKTCECQSTVSFSRGSEKLYEKEVMYSAQYTTDDQVYVELLDVSDLYKN